MLSNNSESTDENAIFLLLIRIKMVKISKRSNKFTDFALYNSEALFNHYAYIVQLCTYCTNRVLLIQCVSGLSFILS